MLAAARLGVTSPQISATTQIVASQLRPAVVALSSAPKPVLPDRPEFWHTQQSLSSIAPKSCFLKASSGVQGTSRLLFFFGFAKEKVKKYDYDGCSLCCYSIIIIFINPHYPT